MTTTRNMTLTEARKTARKILRSGHFQRSATHVQIRYNGTWLDAYGSCGRPPKGADLTEQIAQAIHDLETERTTS